MLKQMSKMLNQVDARHFNLPNNSTHAITIWSLSLHQGLLESRKNFQQKLIPWVLIEFMNAAHLTKVFLF